MPPMTGRVIAGRYNLQTPIGRGAMGVVWRARDELLDREVAIKEVVISALIGADERRNAYQRTLREARTAARLSHRGVVTVYDVVEEDSRPWIVMELVPSQSLDQVLTVEGRLPAARACRIGQQLLSALAAAHAAGVLHRDVKPSNVLISASRTGEGGDERAVLTDFGIAQFEGDPRLTQTGMVMGSPGFTAPERIRGGDATPGSDLWSLGATIYAAVEGRGPYEQRGGAITTMSAIINEDAPVAPHGGRLAPLIAALLRRDPASRPSASAAARLFASVLPHLTESAAEPPSRAHPPTALVSYLAPNVTAASARPVTDRPAPGSPAPGSPGPVIPVPGNPVPVIPVPGSPVPASPAPGSPGSAADHGAAAADDAAQSSAADAPVAAPPADTPVAAPGAAESAGGGETRVRLKSGAKPESAVKAEPATEGDAAPEPHAKPAAAVASVTAEKADKDDADVSGEPGAGTGPEAGTEKADPAPLPVPADVTVAVPAVGQAKAKESVPAGVPGGGEATAVANPDSVGYQPTQLAIPTQSKNSPPKTPQPPPQQPRPTFTAAARQASGYPPPSGAQRPPTSSQYAGPSQSYPDLAGQYPAGSGGGRAARDANPGSNAAPRRRRRYALLAAAVLVAAAAGVGAALALNSPGGTPPPAVSSSAPAVPDVENQFKSVNALNDPSGAAPAGWQVFSHSGSDLGTTAGFSIDLPPGWQQIRDGQRTLYSGPGSLLLKVDLTPQPLADMVAAATSVEKQSLAKHLLPGYRLSDLVAEPVRNTHGAVWKYSYELDGTAVTVDDILFAKQTPAGLQDYAIYLRAPKANFNGSALTLFDEILRTFQTVPSTKTLPPVPSPAAS